MRRTQILQTIFACAVFVSGATVSAQTQSKAPKGASVEARLQRLEDMEEIRLLLLDYGRLLDARDLAAYSRLFAKYG
jgi:hypothetical protein